jgi:hypothetical protein
VPSPSPPSAPSLTLVGAVNAETASLNAGTPCGSVPGGFYVSVSFAAGSTTYVLTISIAGYAGPGDYAAPPARVSLRPMRTLQPLLYTGTRGNVVVNSDERSGTVSELLSGQTSSVRVTGSWSC